MTQHVAGVDHRQAAATVTFCMIPRADPARRKCLFIVNRTEKRRYFSTPANLIMAARLIFRGEANQGRQRHTVMQRSSRRIRRSTNWSIIIRGMTA
jgi:hypothetical protein